VKSAGDANRNDRSGEPVKSKVEKLMLAADEVVVVKKFL
jgi:hypothetical protein